MRYSWYQRQDFFNFQQDSPIGNSLVGTFKFICFCTEGYWETAANPSVIRAGAQGASDRFAHSQTRDMVDIPTAYTYYNFPSLSPQQEFAYALCTGLPLNPVPHFATLTVFGLRDKQSWIMLISVSKRQMWVTYWSNECSCTMPL